MGQFFKKLGTRFSFEFSGKLFMFFALFFLLLWFERIFPLGFYDRLYRWGNKRNDERGYATGFSKRFRGEWVKTNKILHQNCLKLLKVHNWSCNKSMITTEYNLLTWITISASLSMGTCRRRFAACFLSDHQLFNEIVTFIFKNILAW